MSKRDLFHNGTIYSDFDIKDVTESKSYWTKARMLEIIRFWLEDEAEDWDHYCNDPMYKYATTDEIMAGISKLTKQQIFEAFFRYDHVEYGTHGNEWDTFRIDEDWLVSFFINNGNVDVPSGFEGKFEILKSDHREEIRWAKTMKGAIANAAKMNESGIGSTLEWDDTATIFFMNGEMASIYQYWWTINLFDLVPEIEENIQLAYLKKWADENGF